MVELMIQFGFSRLVIDQICLFYLSFLDSRKNCRSNVKTRITDNSK